MAPVSFCVFVFLDPYLDCFVCCDSCRFAFPKYECCNDGVAAVCAMGSSPVQCSCQCACKGRDEAHDRARDAGIQYRAHGEMRKREMEDKKSERGRGDRMRKLTEGDGGS